jgi:hypothetical protein
LLFIFEQLSEIWKHFDFLLCWLEENALPTGVNDDDGDDDVEVAKANKINNNNNNKERL